MRPTTHHKLASVMTSVNSTETAVRTTFHNALALADVDPAWTIANLANATLIVKITVTAALITTASVLQQEDVSCTTTSWSNILLFDKALVLIKEGHL